MNSLWKKLIQTALGLYMFAAFAIFTPYFNWQYARDNGFSEWLLFGEFIPTAKAIAWPFFLGSSPSTGLRETVSHVKKSLEYANLATQLINRGGPYQKIAQQDMDLILDFYRKALSEAKQADIGSMNRHYRGFGDHFQQEFIKGMDLFLQSSHSGVPMNAVAGQTLMDQWGTWYGAHIDQIRKK